MADGTGSLVEGLGAELLNNTGIPISPWDIHGEIYGMNGLVYFIKSIIYDTFNNSFYFFLS